MRPLSRLQFLYKCNQVRHVIFLLLGMSITYFLFQYFADILPSSSDDEVKISKEFIPLKSVPKTAEEVQTGIYVVNIHSVDPATYTYTVDCYLWFLWKGNIDPTKELEFDNNIEKSGMVITPSYETPELLPDGRHYQIWHVEGRFRDVFTFSRYPLDKQRVGLVLENSVYTTNQLVYTADKSQSGISSDLTIPGWEITGYQMLNLYHTYPTNFGDPRGRSNLSRYSAFRFEINLERNPSFFIWKLLLPMFVVMFTSWGQLVLSPSYVDSRMMLPGTALLTLVFLQQSYSASLPAIGKLVLIDKIYSLAFVLILTAIIEAIYTANLTDSEDPNNFAKALKTDIYFLVITVITMAIGMAYLIFW